MFLISAECNFKTHWHKNQQKSSLTKDMLQSLFLCLQIAHVLASIVIKLYWVRNHDVGSCQIPSMLPHAIKMTQLNLGGSLWPEDHVHVIKSTVGFFCLVFQTMLSVKSLQDSDKARVIKAGMLVRTGFSWVIAEDLALLVSCTCWCQSGEFLIMGNKASGGNEEA